MIAVPTSEMRPLDAGYHQIEDATFHTPEDPEWMKALGKVRADFYYLPGYVRLAAAQEGGQPLLFVARHKQDIWLLPLIVRVIPGQLAGRQVLYDAVSPYGYSGPLASVRDASDFTRWNERAAGLLKAALVRRGIVAAFIRLHPLRPVALGALERHGSLGAPRATVVVDLTRSIDRLWRETRKGHRSAIRALQRCGYNAHMDHDLLHLQRFRLLYEETMQRNGARPQYHFTKNYYDDLQLSLSGRLKLCFVAQGEDIVCAGLFTEMNGTVQYHLSGTDSAHARLGPTKLMVHFVRQWAHERGNKEFHLGGGIGGANDSLLHFKQGFSQSKAIFQTWRLIVDPHIYADLLEHYRLLYGVMPAAGAEDYFPAYRQPITDVLDCDRSPSPTR